MSSTPKGRARTPVKKCNDVEEEFSKRFLSLFTSFYDIPSIEPLQNFPQAPQDQTKSQTPNENKGKALIKYPPFNAIVWDLRLKKNVEYQNEQNQESSSLVTEELDRISDLMDNTSNDETTQSLDFNALQDIFLPTPAERPEVPKYLQNIQQDYIIDNERRRNPNPPLRISEAEKQFEKRLQKQKQHEAERKKKLFERKSQKEKEHMEFLKTLPKTRNHYDMRTSTIQYEMKEKHASALELLNKRREGVKVTPSKSKMRANNDQNQNLERNYYSKE